MAGPALGPPSLPPGVVEMPHSGLFRLLHQDGAYSVQHNLTNEMHALAEGKWSLHLHNDRAFAYNADNKNSVWMNSLMKTSVWHKDQRVWVRTKGQPGQTGTNCWLEDLVQQRTLATVKLDLKVGTVWHGVVDVKLYILPFPRSGASVFWEIMPIAKRVGVHVKDQRLWLRQNLRRTWAPRLRQVYNVPNDHFAAGSCGRTSFEHALNSLGRRAGTKVHQGINIPANRYTSTPVHKYTHTRVHGYTGTSLHQYTAKPVHRYTGTQYTGTPVHW